MRWSIPPPDLAWPALHMVAIVVVNPLSALEAGAGEKLSEIPAPVGSFPLHLVSVALTACV